MTDGIFPRKKNDVEPRFPSDVISRDIRDEQIIEATYDHEVPVDHDVRIEEFEDVESKPIDSEEFPIIQEPTITPPEKIADDIEGKIDLIEEKKLIEESAIVQKEAVTPTEKIVDHAEEKIISITEEKLDQEPFVVQEEIVIPTERVPDRVDEKIEEKDLDVERVAVEPVEKVLIEEPEIIEDEIEQALITEIKLEPSQELEKHCD